VLLRHGDGSASLAQLPDDLVADTADQFGLAIEQSTVREVLLSEERKFTDLLRRGRSLLSRLYPSGRLSEVDYEYLFQTHGLPREVVTELSAELGAL
jgi:alanyl-tRNA synthetase